MQQIALMLGAGNFFEDDFPKARFRGLLWEEACAETRDWRRKTELQDMAVLWSDAQLWEWRERMDDE